MINFNNKTIRNLEEQVLENQNDIEALKQLGMPGVKITAIVDDTEEITDPIVGAFYLVKNESNTYDLYVYTADEEFFDLGEFPKPGPQGQAGNPGPTGATGTSTRWYTGTSFPLVNLKNGDMFLDISSYQVYIYNGSQWISQTNIKGAAGRDGENGNSIQSINHAHIGDETRVTITTTRGGTTIFNIPDGKPGVGFHIAHIYPEDDEDMPSTLPADIVDTLDELWPAEEASPAEAILVKTSTAGDYMFVILTTDGVQTWDEAGQIESVQGPPGTPGTQIMDSQDIEKEEAGPQYPNTYKLYINSIPYLTTAPVADNPNGLKIVVLNAEPATYYNGYYYIITEE